ncbi:phenolic acid decarboxylase [Amycolatopsis sp. NPDC051102]|uniref:phenolic acid decarboxylase n=1 Tax=Amycolatopsis sp. NPDC051102 TaxID=3155163 RepID=UPI003430D75B
MHDTLPGKHLIYTYDSGWQYELYVKNATTIDYRIHSGPVGGRWVKDQAVHTDRLGPGVHTLSWTEPTGTSVALVVDLAHRRLHGVIFFPRWVWEDPAKTVCFQNDHLDRMTALRDTGPAYPVEVVDESARITFVDQCDTDDDGVIDRAPGELPDGYADRTR